MVMLVSWRIDRILMALLAVAGMAGMTLDSFAQQEAPKRPPAQKPARPAQKPPQAAGTPKPSAKSAKAEAARLDALPPSQIGLGTLAQFAFMIDPQTSTVLLFKDADKPMAPSSMAKMMTVYLLFEDLASGKLKLDTRFRVSERAYAITRGTHSSTMFLETTDNPTVGELLQGIVVDSGNDASVAVAEGMAGSEEAFADRMNKKAKELGLTGSVFKNASGWPAEGQMVTARDLALLAWHTINDFPQFYPYYAQQTFTFNGKTQPNRNLELKRMAGVDGLKTGHTEEGGFGQTTSAVRNGRRLILVINGLGSMADRASETTRLLEWGFSSSTNTTIFKPGDTVAEAPVWLGAQDKVPLVASRSVQVTTPTGQTANPRVVAKFDGPLPAPIAKGTKLGSAAVTLPDGRVMEFPLEAGVDVPRQGLIGRVGALARFYLLGWLS
jgi:D-alanyl-D-alanine carboxypeptidase (penicillin-binding protein 5/6)